MQWTYHLLTLQCNTRSNRDTSVQTRPICLSFPLMDWKEVQRHRCLMCWGIHVCRKQIEVQKTKDTRAWRCLLRCSVTGGIYFHGLSTARIRWAQFVEDLNFWRRFELFFIWKLTFLDRVAWFLFVLGVCLDEARSFVEFLGPEKLWSVGWFSGNAAAAGDGPP